MTAADKLLQKTLVSSSIDSARWEQIRASLRDRAFFSSQIASAKFLAEARQTIAAMLAESQTEGGTIHNREDAIRTIRESAVRHGLQPTGTRSVTDPASRTRAALIVDTNAGLAAGYVRHEQNMTVGSRLAYPAQEFLRVSRRNQPRKDWHLRWQKAGGKRYDGTRMIAPVESPVWSRLSRFGLPYPPFDYNSGMGTRLIPRHEAIALGVIKPDETPAPNPSQPGFNDTLQDETPPAIPLSELREIFGDQITATRLPNGSHSIQWTALKLRSAFENPPPQNGRIATMGKATSALMNRLPPALAAAAEGKSCAVTAELVRHLQNSSHWPVEKNLRQNLQLTPAEIDLLPQIWRTPDRTLPGNTPTTAILELDALSGGAYRLVVDFRNSPQILTFYKRK